MISLQKVHVIYVDSNSEKITLRDTESTARIKITARNLIQKKTIYKCDICRMEFDTNPKLKQHSQVHGEKISCNLCEKTILPRSMSRHIKMVHTISQDENNFIRVLSKKKEITCKVCNIVLAKQYNLKRHMQNKHEGYDENIPNRLVFGENIFRFKQ